jgi:hypothetical protein
MSPFDFISVGERSFDGWTCGADAWRSLFGVVLIGRWVGLGAGCAGCGGAAPVGLRDGIAAPECDVGGACTPPP